MMNLAQYLESTGETVAAFAVRVGLNRVSVSRLKHGHQRPSWETAERIAEATGGAVPVTAWIVKHDTPSPAKSQKVVKDCYEAGS